MVVDKRERFVTLAEKRVNRAIQDIRLVGNLANRQNYVYDEKDVAKIIAALEGELKTMKGRFKSGSGNRKADFRLTDGIID